MRFEAEDSEDRDQRTLSLHFLTPRLNRSRFVSAFRALRDRCSMSLLLTGPWPPYHFSAALSRSTTLRSGIKGIAAMGGEQPNERSVSRFEKLYTMLLDSIPSSVLLVDPNLASCRPIETSFKRPVLAVHKSSTGGWKKSFRRFFTSI